MIKTLADDLDHSTSRCVIDELLSFGQTDGQIDRQTDRQR